MCGRIRETLSVLHVGNSRDSSEMAAEKLPAELSTADSGSEILRTAAPKFWSSKIVNSEHFLALTICTNQFGTNIMEGNFFPIWNHCAGSPSRCARGPPPAARSGTEPRGLGGVGTTRRCSCLRRIQASKRIEDGVAAIVSPTGRTSPPGHLLRE